MLSTNGKWLAGRPSGDQVYIPGDSFEGDRAHVVVDNAPIRKVTNSPGLVGNEGSVSLVIPFNDHGMGEARLGNSKREPTGTREKLNAIHLKKP